MTPPSRTSQGLRGGGMPRFLPSHVLTWAILRDNGWSYERIAAEYKTSSSVVRRYLNHRIPAGRWAA